MAPRSDLAWFVFTDQTQTRPPKENTIKSEICPPGRSRPDQTQIQTYLHIPKRIQTRPDWYPDRPSGLVCFIQTKPDQTRPTQTDTSSSRPNPEQNGTLICIQTRPNLMLRCPQNRQYTGGGLLSTYPAYESSASTTNSWTSP